MYIITPVDVLPKWEYLKESKKLKRVNKQTGGSCFKKAHPHYS